MIFIGDTNFDLKSGDTVTKAYMNVLSAQGLVRGISDYTRVELRKGIVTKSCIDHIFVRSRIQDVYCGALGTKLADHRMVAVAMTIGPQIQDVPVFARKINNRLLMQALAEVDWESCLKFNCPLAIYNDVNNKLQNCYKQATSLRKISCSKRNKEPWVFGRVVKACELRDRLFSEWLKDTKNNVNRLAYNKQRNKTNKLVEQQRNIYYNNNINNNQGNMRKLWQLLNRISGKITKSIDENIKKAFQSVGSDQEIANLFAKSFKKNVDDIVPKCDIKLLDENAFRRPINHSMLIRKASSSQIIKIIKGLKNNKAPGCDGIRAADIKSIANKISGSIAHFINQSLASGVYPDDLKKGLVRPIFKGGDSKDCTKYRPITMLPIVDKIVEKYISDQIHEFYRNHDVLSENQFGFQARKSTSLLLSKFTDEINEYLDHKKHVLIILIDYSKAFDTLRHNTLIKKLEDSGVRGPTLEWCTNYLKNRSYQVKVGTSHSQKETVTGGTAQGSVLGPLHYLAYVNDMNNCVEKCSIYQYADDTCLIAAHECLRTAETLLQDDFNRICQWSHDAGLVLNAEKTKLIHIHSNQSRTVDAISIIGHDHNCLHLGIGNVHCKCLPLQQVTDQKYLGLVIDNNFNWGPHINNICNRLRAILAKFYIIKNRIPFKIRLQMYNALAESIITYGLSSYGRTFRSYLDDIYKLQVRLLKLVVPFNFKIRIWDEAELFTYCKVLPVHLNFKFQMLKEHFFRTEIQNPTSHFKLTRQVTNKILLKPKTNNYYGRERLNI
ncbi:reverse transcriptase (RNA-dependent DNA polymerase) domain-containing protein [Phthorimaea operculella]|nr:reverse transcriptase (RNA-dependent DNA polymerase) domain-containing protein [Phthorimaea operculella]